MNIVLASSSPYRKALLSKVINQFQCDAPNIDEAHLSTENFRQMAERLSISKAQALAASHPNSLIIGSDQVACVDDQILRKPLNKETNLSQLKLCQGKVAYFYTGLCLLNTQTGHYQSSVEQYTTKFRSLSDTQLSNYIDREKPFDCAGGFKMEGLGIALFEAIEGNDPNILIGLPLISLIDMLKEEGVSIL